MHLSQDGRPSSHFTRLCLGAVPSQHEEPRGRLEQGQCAAEANTYLQLRHPVLTLGLLVLARFSFGLLGAPRGVAGAPIVGRAPEDRPKGVVMGTNYITSKNGRIEVCAHSHGSGYGAWRQMLGECEPARQHSFIHLERRERTD